MPPIAFITGITGQDGSYLADLLIDKGYEVHGMIRRSSLFNTSRIDHLYVDLHVASARLFLHYGDLSDGNRLGSLLREVRPSEIYNLGAQSHVGASFETPVFTADVSGLGALRMLEAVRGLDDDVRYYQASSSEMFGNAEDYPQDENTRFRPRSPYGAAKAYAHWQTVNYRDAYGIYACNGILFNHESPRRGETFVTRKITRAATRIKLGLQDRLYLGNLDAERDWGFAGDYVRGMWMMLQHDQPDDYVLASGERRSVREFCAASFERLDLDWERYVEIDPRYLRPTEIDVLQGDASKARKVLGWEPTVGFDDLVTMMIDADLELAKQEQALIDVGLMHNPWPDGRHS